MTTEFHSTSPSADSSEHPYPQRVPDLPRRAIEAALATSTDERAWALIRLAADLRVLGEIDTALVALDTAWHLHPSTEPARAMFSCAIACHCDTAAYTKAETIASEQPEEFHDLKFSRAAVRLYSTLLEETGEERWAIYLDHYRAHIDGSDRRDGRADGIAAT
jgi:hypothetical protein